MDTKNNNNNNATGSILLVSYRDSEFLRVVEKNRGAYVLDGRAKGWSQDKELRADALKKKFGSRYTLIPSLTLSPGEAPEDFIKKSAAAISRIIEVAETGKSIIITNFSSRLLKCIGHMIMSINPEIKVFLKWETVEDSGISRQKPMSPEDFANKMTKLSESMETFSAKGESDFDEEAFASL